MRILICSFTFSSQANGVAEVVREQAIGLAARGHEVTATTGVEVRRTQADSFGVLQIREFQCNGIFGSRASYTGDFAGYRNFVARCETDAVICHGWENWATDVGCVFELPGSVVVRDIQELPAALHTLRCDADRLAALASTGLAAARSDCHWEKVLARHDLLPRGLAEKHSNKIK